MWIVLVWNQPSIKDKALILAEVFVDLVENVSFRSSHGHGDDSFDNGQIKMQDPAPT